MKALLIAAQRGDAGAQFNLGVLYDNGQTVTADRAHAIKWLLCAARQGLPRAQHRLAEVYERGDMPSDRMRSCAWYLVASDASSGVYRYNAQRGYESTSVHLTPAELGTVRRFASIWTARRNAAVPTRLAR